MLATRNGNTANPDNMHAIIRPNRNIGEPRGWRRSRNLPRLTPPAIPSHHTTGQRPDHERDDDEGNPKYDCARLSHGIATAAGACARRRTIWRTLMSVPRNNQL